MILSPYPTTIHKLIGDFTIPTLIEVFSNSIDDFTYLISFNKDEQALLRNVLPLLEQNSHSSLSEAVEILEQIFAKNEEPRLIDIIVSIYAALENEEKAAEWEQKSEGAYKKSLEKMLAEYHESSANLKETLRRVRNIPPEGHAMMASLFKKYLDEQRNEEEFENKENK